MAKQIKISGTQESISPAEFKKAKEAFNTHSWIEEISILDIETDNSAFYSFGERVYSENEFLSLSNRLAVVTCSVCDFKGSMKDSCPGVYFDKDGFHIQYFTCNEKVVQDIII